MLFCTYFNNALSAVIYLKLISNMLLQCCNFLFGFLIFSMHDVYCGKTIIISFDQVRPYA